jgi:2-methylcitrate dehydratase PrpD
MALAAHDVTPGPMWYTDEWLMSDSIVDFAKRVTVALEPGSNEIMGEQLRTLGHALRAPASVEISARDTTFTACKDVARGDPYDPTTVLTDDALEQKFRDFCALALSGAQINEAVTVVAGLEQEPRVDTLVANLVSNH